MAHKDIAAISKVDRRIWQQKIQTAVESVWAEIEPHLPDDQRSEDGTVFKLLGQIYVLADKAPNAQQFQALEQSLKEASAMIESTRSAAQDWRSQRDAAVKELADLLHDLRRGNTRRPEIRELLQEEADTVYNQAYASLPAEWADAFGWSSDEAQALFEALSRDPNNLDEPDVYRGYSDMDLKRFRGDLRDLIHTHIMKKGD